jgi:hypothetical protein
LASLAGGLTVEDEDAITTKEFHLIIAPHVNFDLLPSECKCLLIIATMAASLQAGNRHRQSGDALTSVARGFWNDSRLTPADLGNLGSITDQLCIYYKSTRTTQY